LAQQSPGHPADARLGFRRDIFVAQRRLPHWKISGKT
jgi:hypothetical protein